MPNDKPTSDKPMNHVALFGTSADPPTIAHAKILQMLAAQFDHVAVWAADNPFKSDQTPLDLRHQMLGLLIEELGDGLRSTEADRVKLYPELSYPRTWTTLEKAKSLWPQAAFTLVVGADILPQLPRWYRATELLQQLRVLVVPRQGYEINQADLDRLQTLAIQVEVAQVAPPQVSSSEYRKQGDAMNFLTPRIRSYLDRSQIYGRFPLSSGIRQVQQQQVQQQQVQQQQVQQKSFPQVFQWQANLPTNQIAPH
jgi:nicotinate-nucleotide adenylyltransferase